MIDQKCSGGYDGDIFTRAIDHLPGKSFGPLPRLFCYAHSVRNKNWSELIHVDVLRNQHYYFLNMMASLCTVTAKAVADQADWTKTCFSI